MTMLILTGDVNLMKVADAAVPFRARRPRSCARPTSCSAISNAACTRRRPATRSATRAFLPTPRSAARRSSAPASTPSASPTTCTTARPRSSLRSRGSTRSASCTPAPAPNLAAARAPAIVERNGSALRLSAAQLGLLADRSRGAQGRGRHRRHPRPHRLSRADVAGCGPSMPPPNRPGVPPEIITWADAAYLRAFTGGHRGAAPAGRRAGGVLPLGAWTRRCCNT